MYTNSYKAKTPNYLENAIFHQTYNQKHKNTQNTLTNPFFNIRASKLPATHKT